MDRSYYSESFKDFLAEDVHSILGKLVSGAASHHRQLEQRQTNAWQKQIEILKSELNDMKIQHILFEYSIPRRGKRVDNVLFYNGVVYLLEFKVVDSKKYESKDLTQAFEYASDLKDFQDGSSDISLVPILVSTDADDIDNEIGLDRDGIVNPVLKANTSTLKQTILQASREPNLVPTKLKPKDWENSEYRPSPSVVEAAQALWIGHTVDEISRKGAKQHQFEATINSVNQIIKDAKKNNTNCIVFVTGVPGSGKTLVGMTVANQMRFDKELAVYISGTSPLIDVLREALARDSDNYQDGKKAATVFLQHLRHFRQHAIVEKYNFTSTSTTKRYQDYASSTEKLVVFDEAQRAWDKERTAKEVKKIYRVENFDHSEPDVLLNYINKPNEWCVVICLIGEGQEINPGELGTTEWLKTVRERFGHWHVFLPPNIDSPEYLGENSLDEELDGIPAAQRHYVDELHLMTGIRSFRTIFFGPFVSALLDRKIDEAKKLYSQIKNDYPIRITRDLDTAKKWVKEKARGRIEDGKKIPVQRYGIFVDSRSGRLLPEAIPPKMTSDFNPGRWFLDTADYVDSSYFMEIPATEFNCQGLEVDWAVVAWDASMRPTKDGWSYHKLARYFSRKEIVTRFQGSYWQNIRKPELQQYRKNAHRVLLTRARQGIVIFVPSGDPDDHTRKPEYYDGIFNYFKEIGIEEIP